MPRNSLYVKIKLLIDLLCFLYGLLQHLTGNKE